MRVDLSQNRRPHSAGLAGASGSGIICDCPAMQGVGTASSLILSRHSPVSSSFYAFNRRADILPKGHFTHMCQYFYKGKKKLSNYILAHMCRYV